MQESQETKFEIECTGAKLDLAQPDTIETMVQYASYYAQHNQGVKYHAVLLPFSALSSYNEAEGQFEGIRLMSWVEHGSHILKDLNFEHVRLQRLKKALADKAQLKTVVHAVREYAKHKVIPSCSDSNKRASWIVSASAFSSYAKHLSYGKHEHWCCQCNFYLHIDHGRLTSIYDLGLLTVGPDGPAQL